MFMTLIDTRFLSLPGRKLVRAISAESIYRCMSLFLDHILYGRAHFVRASRAVLAMISKSNLQRYILSAEIALTNFLPGSWQTENLGLANKRHEVTRNECQ